MARAYEKTSTEHSDRLAQYDVNPDFLRFEGAAELAKVLVPGLRPSHGKLAERCVDSLNPGLDEDTRWDRVATLRPVFRSLVDSLSDEVRREPALSAVLDPVERTTTATSTDQLARHLGAVTATDDDEAAYLHWVIDCHRYLRTVGMVRNTAVQLRLLDVFVGLSAQRYRRHDQARAWLDREEAKLRV
ncbi:MAG TPA: hypothetical protein VGD43_14575 [Micromonospora sp.]